jgi:Ca2+-binding RTX toxin-like protein
MASIQYSDINSLIDPLIYSNLLGIQRDEEGNPIIEGGQIQNDGIIDELAGDSEKINTLSKAVLTNNLSEDISIQSISNIKSNFTWVKTDQDENVSEIQNNHITIIGTNFKNTNSNTTISTINVDTLTTLTNGDLSNVIHNRNTTFNLHSTPFIDNSNIKFFGKTSSTKGFDIQNQNTPEIDDDIVESQNNTKSWKGEFTTDSTGNVSGKLTNYSSTYSNIVKDNSYSSAGSLSFTSKSGLSIDSSFSMKGSVAGLKFTNSWLDQYNSNKVSYSSSDNNLLLANALSQYAINQETDNSKFMIAAALMFGNDTIQGTKNDDDLYGAGGADTISALDGNDKLNGGLGADKLTGGKGADTFIFTSIDESGIAVKTRDTITDFKHSENDKIDLSATDSKSGVDGNQAFTYIGNIAFSNDATGQLRLDPKTGILYGSTNADNTPEFSILLSGVKSLLAEDFIL